MVHLNKEYENLVGLDASKTICEEKERRSTIIHVHIMYMYIIMCTWCEFSVHVYIHVGALTCRDDMYYICIQHKEWITNTNRPEIFVYM